MVQRISTHRIRFNFWLDMFKPDEEAIADQIEILKNERSFTQTIRDGIRLVCDLKNGKLDVLFELFPWVRAEFMEYMRDLHPIAPPQLDSAPAQQGSQQSPQQAYADQAWLTAEQERLEAERKWHEKRMADAEKALEAEREKIANERKQSQHILSEQLERLEQLLLQQGNQPISGGLQPIDSGAGGSPSGNSSGLQSLNVPQFSTPRYDDEDDDDLLLEVKQAKGDGQATQNFLRSMQALQQ